MRDVGSTSTRDVRAIVSNLSVEIRTLVLFSGLLGLLVFGNAWGVFTPDTKPEIFMQPGETARRYAQSWIDSPGLGAASYNTGVAPLAAMFAMLESLGVPAWVIMRLWRLSLLLLAAWGARLAVRELVGRSVQGNALAVAGVVAAVVYAANPYVVVGGGTTPTLQPYALLPWLVFCWLRGFRRPSWRWIVAAALVLAAMGGLNAGVVPLIQLVIVIPLAVHALAVERIRFRAVAGVIGGTGLLYALLSAYWLVPALQALGAGTAVAEGTESPQAINAANSYAEVLRGLGMWTLYGGDGSGPFNPSHLPYVTTPLVVLLSFGIPVLAAVGARLSTSPARLFGAVSVLLGGLLMVGLFPMSERSGWSRALEWAFDTIPGVIAFRTTNKVGAVLELGLAVLVALAAAALLPRLAETWQRVVAVIAGLAVTAASVAPALTGGLFPIKMDLPDYWLDAGQVVNERGGDSRVLMVPGSGAVNYDWGYRGPDEIGSALFSRPFVYRTVYPSGDEYGTALLAEVDRRLRLGTLPPGAMSVMARYLGAGDVVARYGVASDDIDPGMVEAQLDADPGLASAGVFEAPDDRTASFASARQVKDVGNGPPVRLVPASGALIVDGTGAALPSLTSAGLTADAPLLLLSPSLSDVQLGQAMADGGRLVLTDSNLRREASNTQATGFGPVLPSEVEPEVTRALYGAEHQTTAVFTGNATAEHRGQTWSLGMFGYGAIEQGFDGDASTSWRFGHFKTGVGHAAVITPDEPRVIDRILLHPLNRSDSFITEVTVTAVLGDRTVESVARLEEWRTIPTAVDLPSEPITRLEIEVTGIGGSGNGPVGFTEIEIPGIDIGRVLSLSDDLSSRVPEAARDAGVDLSDVPMDVVLERSTGDAAGGTSEEATLRREFDLADERVFDVQGRVRLAEGAEDWRIDVVSGAGGPVRAASSSRLDGSFQHRASMAIDGSMSRPDLTTGWSPNEPVVGEWISVDFPRQHLDSLTINQGTSDGHATEVLISLDDGEPFAATLQQGETTVGLPQPMEAARVRILITERTGTEVVFHDIGLPRIRGALAPEPCQTVGWIDNRPIRARVGEGMGQMLDGSSVPFALCGGPITLGAGRHLLTEARGYALDLLHLTDGKSAAGPVSPEQLEVQDYQADSMIATVESECHTCWLSFGQSVDSRWTASINGMSLGPATVVDGYAAGWRLKDAQGTTIRVDFTPQRLGSLAWLLSVAALLLGLAAIAFAAFRRWMRTRKGVGHPQDSTEPSPRDVAPRDSRRARRVQRRQFDEAIPMVLAVLAVPAIWWTVGSFAAGLVAVLLVLDWIVFPDRQVLPRIAVLVMLGVPMAWFIGSGLPLYPSVPRIQSNMLAHSTAGVAVWLLFLAVLVGWRTTRQDEE